MLGFFIDGRESMKVRRGSMNCVVFWDPSQYYGAIYVMSSREDPSDLAEADLRHVSFSRKPAKRARRYKNAGFSVVVNLSIDPTIFRFAGKNLS